MMLSPWVNRQSTPRKGFPFSFLQVEQQAVAGELVEETLLPILSNNFEVWGEKLKGPPKPGTPILLPRDSSPESY